MTTGNPFDIPEILDKILVKLGVKSIPTSTRLICKAWNESWIRLYMKLPEKIIKDQTGTEYISKLYSLLKTSDSPFVFFRSLNCRWENPGIQDLLTEFGSNLKSLNLTFDLLEVSPLLSILVDLCPNLEEFKLCICTPVTLEGFDIETSQFRGRTLPNLKRLFIWDSYNDRTESTDLVLLKWILKTSVNLKSLNFKSSISSSLTLETIKKIDEDPEIKIRLDELDINCSCTEEFHPLEQYLDIRLIQNLKSLSLSSCQRFSKIEISNLLPKFANSLEILTLRHDFDPESFLDALHPNNPDRHLKFPYMPRLKTINNFAYRSIRLESSDFLAKVPNLERLTIQNSSEFENIPRLADYFVLSQSRSEPHLALKELIFMANICQSEMFRVINRLFPNLLKFHIGINPAYLDQQMNFIKFPEMKKLEDLTVELSSSPNEWNPEINLSKIFEQLASSKQLKRLTIINSSGKIEEDLFVSNIMKLLAVLPNLLCLRLYKVAMEIPTARRFLEALRSRPNLSTRVEFVEVDPRKELFMNNL